MSQKMDQIPSPQIESHLHRLQLCTDVEAARGCKRTNTKATTAVTVPVAISAHSTTAYAKWRSGGKMVPTTIVASSALNMRAEAKRKDEPFPVNPRFCKCVRPWGGGR